jgi:hypothetical protein
MAMNIMECLELVNQVENRKRHSNYVRVTSSAYTSESLTKKGLEVWLNKFYIQTGKKWVLRNKTVPEKGLNAHQVRKAGSELACI